MARSSARGSATLLDPATDIRSVAYAAIFLGVCGATFDIVLDAYRIELLEPGQRGVGSEMSQYGWRIGAAVAGALALSALATSVFMGEPRRRRDLSSKRGARELPDAFISPLKDFFRRRDSSKDIRGFFGSLSHEWLMRFLGLRISDWRVLTRIQAWRKAGIFEEGR